MTTTLSRRHVLHAAAWAAPAIALAVATPALAASPVESIEASGPYVLTDRALIITFPSAPDIYEAHIDLPDGTSLRLGTNYGTAPEPGTAVWIIPLPARPRRVKVHPFNDWYLS